MPREQDSSIPLFLLAGMTGLYITQFYNLKILNDIRGVVEAAEGGIEVKGRERKGPSDGERSEGSSEGGDKKAAGADADVEAAPAGSGWGAWGSGMR